VRTFGQLTADEQTKAERVAADQLLTEIVEGGLRFSDEKNGDHLQAKIDKAVRKAERLQTPWFSGEHIMDAAGDEIRGMARCDAEDALYPDKGERVIYL